MRKTTILQSLILIMTVLASGLFAQIQEVRVEVPGMTWGLWAYGVKKTLKRLSGVQEAEVRLAQQDAKIILKPGEALNPELLRDGVRKADFTAQKIYLTVSGELIAKDDSLMLKVPDSGQIFLLLSGTEQETEEANPLTQLRNVSEKGQKIVVVSGEVPENAKTRLKILVEKYELVFESGDK